MPFDGTEYPETTAKKMLKVFGENGEHWIQDLLFDGGGGKCLMGCFNSVTTGSAGYPSDYEGTGWKLLRAAAIRAGAKPRPGLYSERRAMIETVARWNNSTTWPQIKLALEYMHEAEIAEMVSAE